MWFERDKKGKKNGKSEGEKGGFMVYEQKR